jgi:DNA primase
MIEQHDIYTLQSLPIEQVAEVLGYRVTRHKALCPFHNDTHASLTFNTRKNRYRCYVCGAQGDSINLVMKSLRINFLDACSYLSDQFGLGITPTDNKCTTKRQVSSVKTKFFNKTKDNEKPDIAYLERLMAQPILNNEAKQFLFDERKLSPEVIASLGISSISYNCPMSSSPKPTYYDGPALLIPYRDINGKLLSVQSRYLAPHNANNEVPRFRFPRGSHCSIYNLPVLKTLKPGDHLFITEGCSDCWALLSVGYKAIAIPSATLLKRKDAELLSTFHFQHSTPFRMYPDRDAPGERLFLQLQNVLPSLQHHQLPPGCKDYSEYYVQSRK